MEFSSQASTKATARSAPARELRDLFVVGSPMTMKRASLVLLLALSVGVLAIPFSRASARAHARALSSVESGTTPYRRNEPSTTSLTAPQSSKLVLEQHDVRYSGTLSDDVR